MRCELLIDQNNGNFEGQKAFAYLQLKRDPTSAKKVNEPLWWTTM